MVIVIITKVITLRFSIAFLLPWNQSWSKTSLRKKFCLNFSDLPVLPSQSFFYYPCGEVGSVLEGWRIPAELALVSTTSWQGSRCCYGDWAGEGMEKWVQLYSGLSERRVGTALLRQVSRRGVWGKPGGWAVASLAKDMWFLILNTIHPTPDHWVFLSYLSFIRWSAHWMILPHTTAFGTWTVLGLGSEGRLGLVFPFLVAFRVVWKVINE